MRLASPRRWPVWTLTEAALFPTRNSPRAITTTRSPPVTLIVACSECGMGFFCQAEKLHSCGLVMNDIKTLWNTLNADKDGFVEAEELRVGFQGMGLHLSVRGRAVTLTVTLVVTLTSTRTLPASLGLPVTLILPLTPSLVEAVNQLVCVADASGDGRISYDEFVKVSAASSLTAVVGLEPHPPLSGFRRCTPRNGSRPRRWGWQRAGSRASRQGRIPCIAG